MNNIKKVQTFQIKKSVIPLVVICILTITTFCYDEYLSLELKHQLIPSVYSQSQCLPNHINVGPTFDSKDFKNPKEWTFNILGKTARENLLNVKITTATPGGIICHDYGTTPTIYSPTSEIVLTISSSKLKDSATQQIPALNFNANPHPIKKIIDHDNDGILNSLDTLDNILDRPTPKPEPNTNCLTIDSTKEFECERGKTNLIIKKNGQNLILGASSKDPNGIIVISENTGNPNQSAEIQACKEKIKYKLTLNSALEIICK